MHLRFSCWILCFFNAFCFINAAGQKHVRTLGNVVVLTDLNFDVLVNGSHPWMVDIYAPWCPACIDLEPLWRDLAEELRPEGILFGKVDGTKEQGLIQRFSLTQYPSIFHLYQFETREYMGPKKKRELAAFAREAWRNTKPITGCSSPISRCGRFIGELTKIPSRLKSAYLHLRNERKYSDVSLLAGVLALPVAVGLMLICLLDAYYSRIPLAGTHPHED